MEGRGRKPIGNDPHTQALRPLNCPYLLSVIFNWQQLYYRFHQNVSILPWVKHQPDYSVKRENASPCLAGCILVLKESCALAQQVSAAPATLTLSIVIPEIYDPEPQHPSPRTLVSQ
jgi:hypothetical protein